MNDKASETLATYQDKRPLYEAYTNSIENLLRLFLFKERIDAFTIETRTKTAESLDDKPNRDGKDGKYTSLCDVTDVSGVRIVGYYLDDVKRICDIITKIFKIDIENSIDKQATIDPDRFGYLSVHYIVSHSDQRCSLPEYESYKGLKAEIQVRTVLQHSWAVLDRRLRYNNERDIPREIRRKFFRISALLEAADESLTEIDKAVRELRARYSKEFKTGAFDADLNVDSLEVFFKQSPALKTLAATARTNRVLLLVSLNAEVISNTVELCNKCGITNISKLESVLLDFGKHIEVVISRRKEDESRTPFISKIGIMRMAILHSIGKEAAESIVKNHMKFSPKNREFYIYGLFGN